MSDGQFNALIAALGTFGASLLAMIRWAVLRIAKSLDDNTLSHVESAKQMAVLSTKVQFAYDTSQKVDTFVREERSDVYEVDELGMPHRRARTPPKGSPIR